MQTLMDNLGMTRLGVAAWCGDTDEVKHLLTTTDNVFERDVYGNTAAHYAIARYTTTEDKSMDVTLLLSKHADLLRIPNKNKQVPAHILDGEALKCTDVYESTCER
eukprot:135930-Prymnesium_polylepis.1